MQLLSVDILLLAQFFFKSCFGNLSKIGSISTNIERCNPQDFIKKPHPTIQTSYFYCNADGTLAKRDCAQGKHFNKSSLECEFQKLDKESELAIQMPQFQAPDDICSGGIPLTRLSAPVVCNPAISSCPDDYFCTLHSRTGTSYCCQSVVEQIQESTLCTGNQITFFEPLTGMPKSCVLSSTSSCPTGFGCNLVAGSFTRCCGRNFGCPTNSAGFVHPSTGAHVQCNSADPLSCPSGFVCTHSSMFNTAICCSDTSTSPTDFCGGENPLGRPNPCAASSPCPAGFSCRNGRCCPSRGLCPAGTPLGGVTSCSASNPCPNNYQCVTSNGQQHCCPAPEHVCGQPKDSGLACETRAVAVSRYYFDSATGSCRAFQFSQCSGNSNNFDTLEQCESFCLEQQCPQGQGLRAGPSIATCTTRQLYRDSGFGIAADPDSTCPAHYSCVQPLFGANFICCTSSEYVCRDSVTAGTACFGAFLTIQRFHYNAERGQCEPFQYYGCNGSGNNFLTKRQCEAACQPPLKSACNGVAPLNDEGDYVQRCSENVKCPSGSWCNTRGYCCPHTDTACQSPRSIGHTCLSQKPGTYWYFDTTAETCMPFIFSGCGGTPNRFSTRESCEQICINKLGECPRGMAPFLTTTGTKQCTLNVAGTCPEGSSCVRSNLGEPICCTSTAQCPNRRTPYVIPGSDSNVACLPDDDNCPQGNQCLQSSNVPGFYMCCSSSGSLRRSSLPNNAGAVARHSITAMAPFIKAQTAAKFAAAPKCPADLPSNGLRCTVNEIEACPTGYVCLGGESIHGVCCKASLKCTKRRKPYYVVKRQILTCGDDEAGCPRESTCSTSNIEGVDICCQHRSSTSTKNVLSETSMPGPSSSLIHSTFSKVPKVVPKCRDGSLPFFALGSRIAQSCTADRDDECPEEFECDLASDDQYYCCPAWDRCPNNASPFLVEGSRKPLGCNWMANNCPEGYSCEGSKDRAICCRARPIAAQCPMGRSPFLYAKRPLVCPPGKKNCPAGYDCVATRGNLHICCSSIEHHSPECVNGFAYFDPATSKNQICDPTIDACPAGYRCKRSTMANAHVCCTNIIDNRYDGYCPPGQIPYTGMTGADMTPPTCHMILSPCPTTAAYSCIYSVEKQNSYCCAPVETAAAALATVARYSNTATINNHHPHSHINSAAGNKQSGAEEMLRQQQYQQHLQLQQQKYVPGYPTNNNGGINTQQNLQPCQSPPTATTTQDNGCDGQENNNNNNNNNPYSNYPDPFFNSAGTYGYSSSTSNIDTIAQQQHQFLQQQYLMNTIASMQPNSNYLAASNENQASSVPESLFVASCPPWSKPLLNPQTQLGHACSTWSKCPIGFTCYSNFPDGRNAHCCTTVPLDNQVVFRANTGSSVSTQLQMPQYAPERLVAENTTEKIEEKGEISNSNVSASEKETTVQKLIEGMIKCPKGTVNVDGRQCKRMYFVGQQGCISDLQCAQRTNDTRCYKGYCSCDNGLLIHESKCVLQCPEGFLNIASRCHDLTAIVFMDSVEERENGTIGGYCLETVVREEQCNVENAYCNERSVTCQCKPGFELHMEDFANKTDKGSCKEVEGSKFTLQNSSEIYENDNIHIQNLDEELSSEISLEISSEGISLPTTFYIIESKNNETNSKAENLGKKSNSTIQNEHITSTIKTITNISVISMTSEPSNSTNNETKTTNSESLAGIFFQSDDDDQ